MAVDSTNGIITASAFLELAGAADDDSAGVDAAVNWASAWLNQRCGYGVKARALTEYYDGDGSDLLYLKAKPASSVQLWCDSARAFGSDTALVEDTDFVVYGDEGKVVLLSGGLPAGPRTVKVTYTGGYDSTHRDWYVLESCVARLARWYYDQVRDGHVGKQSISAGGGTTSFLTDVPDDIKDSAVMFARVGGVA